MWGSFCDIRKERKREVERGQTEKEGNVERKENEGEKKSKDIRKGTEKSYRRKMI